MGASPEPPDRVWVLVTQDRASGRILRARTGSLDVLPNIREKCCTETDTEYQEHAHQVVYPDEHQNGGDVPSQKHRLPKGSEAGNDDTGDGEPLAPCSGLWLSLRYRRQLPAERLGRAAEAAPRALPARIPLRVAVASRPLWLPGQNRGSSPGRRARNSRESQRPQERRWSFC